MRCSNVARSLSHTFSISTGAVRQPAEARMSEARQDAPLLRTPLYKFHLERGARLVAFAGHEMPVQYVIGIGEGRQRYALFTNAAGGILDDLMVANRGDHLLLVVNAACKTADLAHLRQHLGETCKIDPLPDRALIALQGPLAQAALARLAPATATMRFMDARTARILGADYERSRSGYTG